MNNMNTDASWKHLEGTLLIILFILFCLYSYTLGFLYLLMRKTHDLQ